MSFTSPLSFASTTSPASIHAWSLVLAASVVTFAATNVDDLILLTTLFASRIPTRRVVIGQYLGFAAIVLVSLLGIWATFSIPPRWIRFLGLLPLAIALKQILRLRNRHRDDQPVRNVGVATIAITTFANGADNIAVYVPFFAISRALLWLILISYGTLVGVWCVVGRSVGNHPFVLQKIERFRHWIVPLVLLCLGIYVLKG